ncbi:MAG: diguanylate cyclase [Trueperaceae bacterium]|nr:diguanylate cyclase [Trueperaceae bacterium]
MFTMSVNATENEIEKIWQLRDEQPRLAREKVQQLLLGIADEHLEARCFTILAFLCFRDNQFEAVTENVYKAKEILETTEDKLWLARLLGMSAVTHQYLGDKNMFFALMQKVLKLAHEINDSDRLFGTYHDLAIYYLDSREDFKKALEHFEKAKAYITEYHQEAFLYLNLGRLYALQGNYDFAQSNFHKALNLGKSHENQRIISFSHELLSWHYLAIQDFEQALSHNQLCKEARKHYDNVLAEDELQLAEIYYHMQSFDQALLVALSALESLDKEKFQSYKPKAYTLISQIYKAQKNYEQALTYFEQGSRLEKALNTEEQQKKQRTLELIYKTEQLKQEARLLEEKNKELEGYVKRLEELNEQVIELSVRDPLTGLYNRRLLFEQAENYCKLARRYGKPLTVAMIDIDHFKQVNDKFLHKAGDQVLVLLADLMQAHFREADLIARYGGEEFAVVMPETSLENAVIACERLRKTIETYDWSIIHPELRVTSSFGLVSQVVCENLEELFSLADKQLYKAKELGRNRLAF